MGLELQDYLATRKVDRRKVEEYKQQMMQKVQAYRLKELRLQSGLTQKQLAERIGVSQRQVSKIECGDLENTQIGTLRGYLRAIGGDLSLEFVSGPARICLT